MKEMEALKNLANTTLDYKDTAGYKLMKHEEFLKNMAKKGEQRKYENTNKLSGSKDRR